MSCLFQCKIQIDKETEEMGAELRVFENGETSDVETELFIGPPEAKMAKVAIAYL